MGNQYHLLIPKTISDVIALEAEEKGYSARKRIIDILEGYITGNNLFNYKENVRKYPKEIKEDYFNVDLTPVAIEDGYLLYKNRGNTKIQLVTITDKEHPFERIELSKYEEVNGRMVKSYSAILVRGLLSNNGKESSIILKNKYNIYEEDYNFLMHKIGKVEDYYLFKKLFGETELNTKNIPPRDLGKPDCWNDALEKVFQYERSDSIDTIIKDHLDWYRGYWMEERLEYCKWEYNGFDMDMMDDAIAGDNTKLLKATAQFKEICKKRDEEREEKMMRGRTKKILSREYTSPGVYLEEFTADFTPEEKTEMKKRWLEGDLTDVYVDRTPPLRRRQGD